METTARALIIQNTPHGGPGRFGDWLEEAGLALETAHPYAGEELPTRLTHQALVTLGGAPMPDDDKAMPWLARSRDLTRQALAQGTPYFGICQGAQLLALVAGGEVRASHGAPEAGSTPLTLRPEATADPLFAALPHHVTAIERHVDAITGLPPGATWLAESARCPHQAFRCGETAWGTQFHPEVSAARVQEWDGAKLRALGYDPAEIRRQAAADEEKSAPVWRTMTHRFAELVQA